MLAERTKREADLAALNTERDRNAAELANQQARSSAAEKSERERQELRNKLAAQLNSILQTKDSARGLIVNMSDVLFDTGQFSLKPGAREKLAQISGIVLAYPSLSWRQRVIPTAWGPRAPIFDCLKAGQTPFASF